MDAQSLGERRAALRKLGDAGSFISGLFADSLNRKLVDIDYYIAMGGSAYSYWHDLAKTDPEQSQHNCLFSELTKRFSV